MKAQLVNASCFGPYEGEDKDGIWTSSLIALLPQGRESNLKIPRSTSILELKFLIAHQITRQDLHIFSKPQEMIRGLVWYRKE